MATKQTLTQRVKALESHAKRGVAGYCILFVGMMGALYMDQQHAKQERDNNSDARQALVEQDIANQKRNAAARRALRNTGNAIAVSGCNRDFRTTMALRRILIASRVETRKAFLRGEVSPEAFRMREAYYSESLRGLIVPDCRKAKTIITDDPNEEVKVPEALYPGKG